MKRYTFFGILSLLLGLRAVEADSFAWSLLGPPAEQGSWVVEVSVESRDALQRLTDTVEPWAVYPEKGLAIARVDAEQWRELVASGFRVGIDIGRTLRLEQPRAPLPGQQAGIPGFPCYRTVEESYASAEALVAARPDLVQWRDIGDSWLRTQNADRGFDLRVLRLRAGSDVGPRPVLLAFGGIHAREYATAELALRFGETLVAGYGVDPDITWLLEEHEVLLVVQANPDGRKEAESGKLWRKNRDNLYCSGTDDRGVDLNRNFEFGWGCCGGGSDQECSTTYRGPSAASEPESIAFEELMRKVFPDQRAPDLDAPADSDAMGMFLDIHSFGEDVLWSWGFTTERPPNDAELYSLGRKLAFFNDYRPQHGSLSTVDGATKDFAYGELGVPGFTIEVGTDFFQDCASFESRIVPDNLEMLLYAAKVVRAPYLEPSGPNAVDPSFLPRPFFQGEVAELTVLLDDTRFNQSNGIEPSQPIVGGEVSIDQPPWSAAQTRRLEPTDGAFDSVVERASLEVDLSGLEPGRHTVYVRGRDASGSWGAVSATFIEVADPRFVAVLEGTIRDASTQRGIDAWIDAGSFSARTDPETGQYRLVLPAGGERDLRVRPKEPTLYPAVDLEPLSVPGGGRSSLRRDIEIPPYERVVDLQWRSRGGWVDRGADFHTDGENVIWSDSLNGPYAPRSERFLTSEPFEIRSLDRYALLFQHAYDFESGFDFGVVEISKDGRPWEAIVRYTGTQSRWSFEELEIDGLEGVRELRIRFRSSSDESVERDGWHLGSPMFVGH